MYNLFLKRFFDILIAFNFLLLVFPFLITTAIVILVFGNVEGVFFTQSRPGKQNKLFKIIKFKTMTDSRDNLGNLLNDKHRMTKFGKFIRNYSIDELPQIINILKGEISLVGPRPLVAKTFTAYNKEVQSKIYNVKPGLTGIGSIIYRDEESIISAVTDEDPHEFYKRVIAPYKGELEMWYQSNCSFFLDLQLIFMTAWVILAPNSRLYEKWFKDLPKHNFQ